ncbi:MAG: 30S ribosomal protein S5 [Candidatus Nanoarchaeia archaeon]
MARQKKLYDKPEEPVAVVAVEEPAPELKEKLEFKTSLGKEVGSGKITSLNEIFARGDKIREPSIFDKFVPNPIIEYVLIGQSRGKFGGGKRKDIKQTQKKTAEGNKPHFSAMAIVGNGNGFVGVGVGKAQESIPAREKAVRNAKLNLIEIVRGCGSWKCGCGEAHSLPFATKGKCGSVEVKLIPAPKGVGLVCDKEVQKLLRAAGYKDIWMKSNGQTRHKIEFIFAVFDALKKATEMKVKEGYKVYRGAL